MGGMTLNLCHGLLTAQQIKCFVNAICFDAF